MGDSDAQLAEGYRRFEGSQDVGGAFECFEASARSDETNAEAWYMAGGMYVVGGQPQHASPFFGRALSLKPDYADAWFEAGNAGLGTERYTEAEHAFQQAARFFGEQGDQLALRTVLSNLGNAQIELGKPHEARKSYERAVEIEPPLCLPVNGLANALEILGLHAEARAASARAVKRMPDCDLGYYNLGRLLRAAERHAEAPLAYAHAVKLNPTHLEFLNGHGTALAGANRNDEARVAYRAALRLAPAWASPYRNLALADLEERKTPTALAYFSHAVALAPATAADNYCDMGTARLELGDRAFPEARADYRRALKLNPTSGLALANYVFISTKLAEWRRADHLAKWLRASTDALLDRVENAAPFEPMPILFLPPYHALGYDRFDAQTVRRLAAAYAGRGATVSGAPSAGGGQGGAEESAAEARRRRAARRRLPVAGLWRPPDLAPDAVGVGAPPKTGQSEGRVLRAVGRRRLGAARVPAGDV